MWNNLRFNLQTNMLKVSWIAISKHWAVTAYIRITWVAFKSTPFNKILCKKSEGNWVCGRAAGLVIIRALKNKDSCVSSLEVLIRLYWRISTFIFFETTLSRYRWHMVFKVYNLVCFDIDLCPWNGQHNQDSEHIIPQSFLVPSFNTLFIPSPSIPKQPLICFLSL